VIGTLTAPPKRTGPAIQNSGCGVQSGAKVGGMGLWAKGRGSGWIRVLVPIVLIVVVVSDLFSE